MMDRFEHLKHLPRVLEIDLAYIDAKDRQYGASWKRRGGVGAFMMLARKWDRLETFMEKAHYDIFAAIEADKGEGQGSDGTVIAEVRDLRRYLALVEAEMVAAGCLEPLAKPSHLSPAQDQMARDMHRTFKDGPDGENQPFAVGDPVYITGDNRQAKIVGMHMPNYADHFVEVQYPNGEKAVLHVGSLVYARRAQMMRPEFAARYGSSEQERAGTPEDGGQHAAESAVEPDPSDGAGGPRRYRRGLTYKEYSLLGEELIPEGTRRDTYVSALYVDRDAEPFPGVSFAEDEWAVMLPGYREEYAR